MVEKHNQIWFLYIHPIQYIYFKTKHNPPYMRYISKISQKNSFYNVLLNFLIIRLNFFYPCISLSLILAKELILLHKFCTINYHKPSYFDLLNRNFIKGLNFFWNTIPQLRYNFQNIKCIDNFASARNYLLK